MAVLWKATFLGGAAAVLLGAGAIWVGVQLLPPAPASIPALAAPAAPELELGNREAPLEVLPAQGAARCLAGLQRALQEGEGPAAATFLDRQAQGLVGEMGRRLARGEGLEQINRFWRTARLEQLLEGEDDCRGLLWAGPGGRRPLEIEFRWNEWKWWVVSRVQARTTRDAQGVRRR